MWEEAGTRTWTHKSYRPLTTLTFRLDHDLWGEAGPLLGS